MCTPSRAYFREPNCCGYYLICVPICTPNSNVFASAVLQKLYLPTGCLPSVVQTIVRTRPLSSPALPSLHLNHRLADTTFQGFHLLLKEAAAVNVVVVVVVDLAVVVVVGALGWGGLAMLVVVAVLVVGCWRLVVLVVLLLMVLVVVLAVHLVLGVRVQLAVLRLMVLVVLAVRLVLGGRVWLAVVSCWECCQVQCVSLWAWDSRGWC